MEQVLAQHVATLKDVILSLPATGEAGFEGLIGEALREITGVPFRLARSGSQFGVDGRASHQADPICFEGKRYSGRLPRNEVLAKLTDVRLHQQDTDIWVLGATSQVGSQLTDDARQLGAKDGFQVLILDWAALDLPPLAVALAMGGTRVQKFLKTYVHDSVKVEKAVEALDAISRSADFSSLADRIRLECNAASVGLALAKRANTDWLIDSFSSRRKARLEFGQPLAPGVKDDLTIRERRGLIDQLNSHLTATCEDRAVFVLGAEGCGKSWLVAQSWLAIPKKPLMLFLTPIDFGDTDRRLDVDKLLVTNLVRQTGEKSSSEASEKRWRRRLEQWRNHPLEGAPRLIVVLDGINQRPDVNWAGAIRRIADELNRLGGRVVVTDRTSDYRQRVAPRLGESVLPVELDVPEWTDLERDAILIASGTQHASVHSSVREKLANPRMLGIALELLSTDQLSGLQELTVHRLLFEHIRKSEQDSPEQPDARVTALRLQQHAQDVMSRVGEGQEDDLLEFRQDVQAVVDGCFFVADENDSTRYSLEDDGLTLALGFLVIDRLDVARRNKRDHRAVLAAILEPIDSLDNTADVVLAALTIAAVDTRFCPGGMVSALVEGFSSLQNASEACFPAFASLAKRRPTEFMEAAQALLVSGGRQPNLNWLQDALIQAGNDPACWKLMAAEVRSWLSLYSLLPELRRPSKAAMADVEQASYELRRNTIMETLESLPSNELAILEKMSEHTDHTSRLVELALLLLAGKPLAQFAQSLVNWRFSVALNPANGTSHNEFAHLVSLNRVDWQHARDELLKASAPLHKAGASSTGKRALASILLATGNHYDAQEAAILTKELVGGRPPYKAWRRVESYCASDPCDPASETPENVQQTAKRYGEIDVSKVSVAMGPTIEESFFNMARPGVARFAPNTAIPKHRDLIEDVLGRSGFPLRQGLLRLRGHAPLLLPEYVQRLVDRRAELSARNATAGLSKEDAWIVSQYHLLLAFPSLTASEQATALLLSKRDERFLRDLFRIAKPLSEKDFEDLLRSACNEGDERRQSLLLQLACHKPITLSRDTRKYIEELVQSSSGEVRAFALGVAARSADEELLSIVARSTWVASGTDGAWYEDWFGSMALIEAARQGLPLSGELVERISSRLYGRAAALLGGPAAHAVASRIDAAIRHTAELDADLIVPDIELEDDSSETCEPSLFTVNEHAPEDEDHIQKMKRLSEDQEAFKQRQIRARSAFREFDKRLERTNAGIALANLSLEGFSAIVSAAPDLADGWHKLFMSVPDSHLPAIRNLALWLANALGKKDPGKAEGLFRRVQKSTPWLRILTGRAGIQLDAMATWTGARDPLLDSLCAARLDCAPTDHDLAVEVLAALLSNQQEVLRAYVEAKLGKPEPAEVARGIMVAGFSDQSDFNSDILERYEGQAGLIGQAHEAAKYAYQRNVWARHWFEMMCQTEDREDFWCYSVLFLKIVDGRFDVWQNSYAQYSSPIQLFSCFLESPIKRRVERWKTHRSKTLFGIDAPNPIFLISSPANR